MCRPGGDWNWPGARDGQGGRQGGGSNPEVKKAQLQELLTQYGPIEYIWFDHAVGTGGLSHPETIAWCKRLQPGCFIGFNHGDQSGADIRLGEMGRPGPLTDHSAAGRHMRDAPSKTYRLAEFTYPILPPHQGGAMWFYSLPKHDILCLPAEKIYRDYLGAKKYGNIYTLDVGPNYEGKLRVIDVATLQKVGRYSLCDVPVVDLTLDPPAISSVIKQVGDGVESFAFHPNGKMAVVTCLAKYHNSIAVLDIEATPARLLYYLDVGGFAQGIEFTPDGGKLFVGSPFANRIEVFDVVGDFELRKSQKFLKTGQGHCSLTIGPTYHK